MHSKAPSTPPARPLKGPVVAVTDRFLGLGPKEPLGFAALGEKLHKWAVPPYLPRWLTG